MITKENDHLKIYTANADELKLITSLNTLFNIDNDDNLTISAVNSNGLIDKILIYNKSLTFDEINDNFILYNSRDKWCLR